MKDENHDIARERQHLKHLFDEETDVSPARLVSFSDGVFAIAITLLVFNLKVPEIHEGNVAELLPEKVLSDFPRVFSYAFSFLLIGVFWTSHHRMLNVVTKVDNRFVWINLIYLLTVCFIPYPSALIGAYPGQLFSKVLYLLSMTLVGSMSLVLWWYASYKHRLIKKDFPRVMVQFYFMRGFTSLVAFSITLGLTLAGIQAWLYFVLIIFPLRWIMRGYFTKQIMRTQ